MTALVSRHEFDRRRPCALAARIMAAGSLGLWIAVIVLGHFCVIPDANRTRDAVMPAMEGRIIGAHERNGPLERVPQR